MTTYTHTYTHNMTENMFAFTPMCLAPLIKILDSMCDQIVMHPVHYSCTFCKRPHVYTQRDILNGTHIHLKMKTFNISWENLGFEMKRRSNSFSVIATFSIWIWILQTYLQNQCYSILVEYVLISSIDFYSGILADISVRNAFLNV